VFIMAAKHIFVVEDEPVLRLALRRLLEWEGFRVSCAADGREALDRLREGDQPSLILLDLRMPGLDGWQFLAEQRRDGALAGIPVVVVSASSEADTPAAVGHVRKPFQPQDLLQAIRRHGEA
jgi:CheY-like chemotaxis protein